MNNIGGLKPLKPDHRDFSHSQVFGAQNIEEVPVSDFRVIEPIARNQGNTDYCTSYAITTASGAQERVILNPEFQFFLTKKGDLGWGADNRSACKSAVKYGSLEQADFPYQGKDRTFILDKNNWPQKYYDKAYLHRKQSFFAVDGGGDKFDNIRATLWQNRAENRVVITGCKWRGEWDNIVTEEYNTEYGTPHAFVVIGQKNIKGQLYLEALSTNSTELSECLYYFPRNVVNREFNYGSFTFKDIDPEVVKRLTKGQRTIIKRLIFLFNELLKNILE
jgi:hypothetical protein